MERIKKLFYIIIIGIMSFTILIDDASADSLKHTKGDRIYYSNTGYIVKHYLGGQTAYCLQWSYGTQNGAMYYSFSDPAITENKRFIAGKIIEDINASSLSDSNKYLYTVRALNSLFKLKGSKDFTSNSTIKNYIDTATQYVNNTEKLCTGNNTSGCFNSDKFKLSYSGSTMNQIGNSNNFISNKITLTGLLKEYGGTGTSYTVKVSSSNANVAICTNSNGTTCNGTSVTISNPTSDYSFYVKVSGATAGSSVTISATGSNSASYPYANPYQHTTYYQALMVQGKKDVSRSLSRTATLYIPDVEKYSITATKTDENGDNLTGASFRVYRADSSGKEIKELAKNSNGAATLSYTETEFATSDEWFNYQYCLVETASPSGYIYGSKEKEPTCVKPVKGKTSVCYNANGDDTHDTEYCESHTLDCSSTQGNFDETSGKCIVTNDAKKETVEATVKDSHSCEGEYTYNTSTNLCELTTSIEPKEDNTCEEGFIFDEEILKCEKKETTEAVTTPTYSCEEGYTLENGENDQKVCVKYSCDENYTYNSDEKSCKIVSDPSVCKRVSDGKIVGNEYCESNSQEYTLVTTSSNSINFVKTNSKNSISISKTDITGEKELSGAKMKICSTKPDSNFDCELAYVTQNGKCTKDEVGVCTSNSDGTMNIYMQWVSDIAPRTWSGLKTGVNYYLVETVAPLGYSVSSYIQFNVNEDGTVTSGNTVVEDNRIIIKDSLTKIVISKQDVATSKELPGATLKLCFAEFDEKGEPHIVTDEDGNCTIPTLEDGSDAIWESTDKPKELVGLPAGTYYLIETITPDDYDTAERILFTLNQDGTVTDAKGKPVKDNKIEMFDKKMKSPATGTGIIAVIIIGLLGLSLGTLFYFKKIKPKSA